MLPWEPAPERGRRVWRGQGLVSSVQLMAARVVVRSHSGIGMSITRCMNHAIDYRDVFHTLPGRGDTMLAGVADLGRGVAIRKRHVST